MGLFGRQQAELSTSERYVQRAPAGQRKNMLAFAALNRICASPVASAARAGEPIADAFGLDQVAQLVRQVLIQDASLAAWVARDALVCLDVALELMGGSWSDNLEAAMGIAGLAPDPEVRPNPTYELSADVSEAVVGLAAYALQVFWAIARPDDPTVQRDRTLYTRLFESRESTTALVAHDITAWACIIVGRLRNLGRLPSEVPWFAPSQAVVVAMDEPGWYPNPYNRSEIVNGDATFQRYWDGRDWTDRIRVRLDRRWVERVHDMYSVPNN